MLLQEEEKASLRFGSLSDYQATLMVVAIFHLGRVSLPNYVHCHWLYQEGEPCDKNPYPEG
jgi:hypothetical protein